MREEEHYVGRRAMEMKVQGRRKRGRPNRRWLDKVNYYDIKEKGLSADEVYDRATWRRMSSYIDPTTKQELRPVVCEGRQIDTYRDLSRIIV